MTRHAAKLLDMLWYASMGLFLGLTGGMVLSVILTFRGSREVDASPGAEPFNDPKFAEYHNDAVAGYIGQDLFMVGGTMAMILFAIAFLARAALYVLDCISRGPMKKRSMESVQGCCLGCAIVYLFLASLSTIELNKSWPNMYDPNASQSELLMLRSNFHSAHGHSEARMRLAWGFSFVALLVSPWSRRPEKTPLQSGDDEDNNQEENHA